jgi:Zn-dependent M28 family amino/carboxypeptidase
MIGNHRDAWTWGAVDPNSGTSVMLEVSRVLMNLKKSNLWRPKRTILFLSWDAEEFGVVGSTEWVEEFQKKLSANGVVYINIDNIIKGELKQIESFVDLKLKAYSISLNLRQLFSANKGITVGVRRAL